MPIAVKIANSAPRELVSEGLQNIVLAGIVDLGMVTGQFGTKPKLQFIFATEETDSQGRPKYLFKRYTNSLHEKSTLRKDFARLAGRKLTDVEIEKGIDDIEKVLVGKQLTAEVEHETNGDRTYANITQFGRPQKTVPIPADFSSLLEKMRKKAGTNKAVANAHGVAVTEDDIPF